MHRKLVPMRMRKQCISARMQQPPCPCHSNGRCRHGYQNTAGTALTNRSRATEPELQNYQKLKQWSSAMPEQWRWCILCPDFQPGTQIVAKRRMKEDFQPKATEFLFIGDACTARIYAVDGTLELQWFMNSVGRVTVSAQVRENGSSQLL